MGYLYALVTRMADVMFVCIVVGGDMLMMVVVVVMLVVGLRIMMVDVIVR